NGERRWEMTAVGPDLYVLFADLPNFTEFPYAYEVEGKPKGNGSVRIEHFNYGPDSVAHEGVPRGKLEKFEWKSKIFPDTVRDCWVYVPAQYDPNGPPVCTMVFQDGGGYANGDQFRAPIVFDNLIHKKEIPVIIGIFINPGVIPQGAGQPSRSNRSFEYDTLS